MTKKSRTILFLIFLLIFLLTAPSIILYNQGYRIDFEKKRIIQTGGLFLKVSPKLADIYLDGKFQKKTDFFFGSALIENLFPKKYKIVVKKEGYQAWEKELEIKEREVTEVKNIILFPTKLDFELLLNDLDFLSFSPDKTKLIFREKKNQELKLFDLERKIKSHLERIGEVLEIKWDPASKRILVKSAEKEKIKYTLWEIDPEIKKIPLDFLKETPTEIFFNPLFPQKIFLLIPEKNFSSLLEVSILEEKVDSFLKEVISCQTFRENIFCLLSNGFLLEINPLSREEKKINFQAMEIKKEVAYQIFFENNNILLKEGGNLFLFNQNSKSFEKIFEDFSDFQISPDKKKIAFIKNNEIWIYFLEKKSQTEKENEKLFLTRFSEKINQISWLGPHYLVFNLGEEIKLAEIDKRDGIQSWPIAKFKNPEIFFDQRKKMLYIFTEGNLYLSARVFP